MTIGSAGVLNGTHYFCFADGSLALHSDTINFPVTGENTYRSAGLGATVTANSGTSSINNTGAGFGLAIEAAIQMQFVSATPILLESENGTVE